MFYKGAKKVDEHFKVTENVKYYDKKNKEFAGNNELGEYVDL